VHERKFTLPAVAPFRLDFTVWALRRRTTNGVDRWDAGRYSRVLVLDGVPVGIVAGQEGTGRDSSLFLTMYCQEPITGRLEGNVLPTVRKMLGLAIDLGPFYRIAAGHAEIEGLAKTFSGVKPPRFPSLFEALVNAIACQQLTLDVGILLITRLAERFGIGFDVNGVTRHAFPRPEDLEYIPEANMKALGYSTQKARAVKELARTFLQQPLDFGHLDEMTAEEIVGRLTALRGIGRWSAEYALLRGLGRLDVFPRDDVGARNNLERLFRLPDKPGYEQIRELTSRWHPYEGMVYFHLLLEKLRQKGLLGAPSTIEEKRLPGCRNGQDEAKR
jgi:DNA-3-methyladenine glycosylase II